MFCPQCKSEYLDGIAECADCKVPLVATLPPEPDHSKGRYVRILSTYNAADIAIIKSMLDDAEIDYYLSNENFTDIALRIQPATLYVLDSQEEDAREALRGVDLRYLALAARE
jgi:hypothetical protein